jgi:NAD(P)-dependent dehydrogenase (short-subunit alcohol dehydrogenase family)
MSVAVSDERDCDVRRFVDVDERYHALDYPRMIAYCAGINVLQYTKDLDLAIAKDIFEVNVFGFMRLAKSVAMHRDENLTSRIAVVSSDAAVRPMRTSLAYCSSKAALDMAIRQSARELSPWCLVNGIAPGMTAPTGMSEYIDATVPPLRGWSREEAFKYEQSQIPMGRRAHPSEMADAMAYLLLDAPPYQTGSITPINGGR